MPPGTQLDKTEFALLLAGLMAFFYLADQFITRTLPWLAHLLGGP